MDVDDLADLGQSILLQLSNYPTVILNSKERNQPYLKFKKKKIKISTFNNPHRINASYEMEDIQKKTHTCNLVFLYVRMIHAFTMYCFLTFFLEKSSREAAKNM